MIASSVVVANKKFSEHGTSQNDINSGNTLAVAAAKSTELAPEERNRGKRMMGVLMGTLSKFKSEEVDKSEAANLKRILLEQKLTMKLQEAKTVLDLEPEPRRVFASSSTGSSNPGTGTGAGYNYDSSSDKSGSSSSVASVACSIGGIRRETEEACAQFQRTQTLPVLYFKRGNI